MTIWSPESHGLPVSVMCALIASEPLPKPMKS